ncbi:hypothetical protein B9Z39_03350 [Limnohabitans sp. JirII-29]|uniref:O-antigen polymerase n=1 Tax=Limnohabitans sp. JirII-29 TaxID=1835756 RepID=UPI000D3CFBEA|nr:O-antigen polymerase [Limnohabitans sp. JirII-29]PUE29123.1 hypothetical protein B9Z39_03350 [Limnohabitans sp. JirII-29]
MLSYILISTMIIIGITPMIYEKRRGRFDFFNLKNTFIFYFVIQLGLSGFATIYFDQPSDIGPDTIANRADYDYALTISAIGLAMFQIGYYSRSKKTWPAPQLLMRPWNIAATRVVIFVYMVLGFVGFAAILQINGGLSSFLESREAFRAGGLTGMGIFLFPATGLMAIAALIYFLRHRKTQSKIQVIKCLGVLIAALIPAYFLGFRSSIALPILQLLVVWNYARARLPFGKITVLSIFIMGIFTFYGIGRAIPSETGFNFDDFARIASERPELVYAVISRSRGTEVVAAVTAKLEKTNEYEYGWSSLVETLTIIIPKAIWPDKPQVLSERFANYFFGLTLTETRGYEAENWSGISPTVIAEWYWHFGLPGVIAGLFFLGRIASGTYNTLLAHKSQPTVVLCYSIIFTSFSMFAESQQNYSNGLVLYAAALTGTFILITNRTRASQIS